MCSYTGLIRIMAQRLIGENTHSLNIEITQRSGALEEFFSAHGQDMDIASGVWGVSVGNCGISELDLDWISVSYSQFSTLLTLYTLILDGMKD